jgi:hypothetical protein
MKTYGAFHSNEYNEGYFEELMRNLDGREERLNDYMNRKFHEEKLRLLTMDIEGIKIDCEAPQKTMLLIQHLREPVTIGDVFRTKESFMEDVPSILFQIYSVLYTLRNEFTHYDLHTGNVIFYKIPDGKYVTMVYHLPNGEGSVTFRTKYIAKIIDYGRCYFKNARQGVWNSSQEFYDTLRSECINDETYETYDSFGDLPLNFHIDSNEQNQSHDLLFAKRLYYRVVGLDDNEERTLGENGGIVLIDVDIVKTYASPKKDEIIQTQFYKEVLERVYYVNYFGTPEVEEKDSTYETSGIIYNVSDMFHALKKYMTTKNDEFTTIQQSKITSPELGTMEIWLDRSRPMTFTGDLTSDERDRRPSFSDNVALRLP